MNDWYTLGQVAQGLLDERDALVNKQGGVTPAQLQEIGGRWAEAVNHGFETRSVYRLLLDLAEEYDLVVEDQGDVNIQEFCAALMLVAMQIAHRNVFDLYESVFEYIGMTLLNVTTMAREEKSREEKADNDHS